MHGKLKPDELISAQDYIPSLEAFKPKIFWGIFRGLFGRVASNSLNWDKLSDAAHGAEAMMPEVYSLMAPRAAGEQPADEVDQELADALLAVSQMGMQLMQNPEPSQTAVDQFKQAVRHLEDYISARHENQWDKAQRRVRSGDKALQYVPKTADLTGSLVDAFGKLSDEKSSTAAFAKLWDTKINWGVVPLSTINTLVNSFLFLGTLGNAIKAGKNGVSGFALLKEWGRVGKDTADLGTSIYGKVRGFATAAGATWQTSTPAVGAAGGLALGVATLSLVQGGFRLWEAGKDQKNLEKYESDQFLQNPQAQPELEAKRQMLLEITRTQKDAAQRRKVTAGLQMASAAASGVAGGLMLSSAGAAAVASAVFSGFALALGLANTVTDYVMRGGEREKVIDRFIGLDEIYGQFKQDYAGGGDDAFHKKYGKEDAVRSMLRKQAVHALGFPSVEKMHVYIMDRYAEALYKGAFLKADGTLLLAAEENDPQSGERENRKLYVNLIRSLGFDVTYPTVAADHPSPGKAEIFKKLMK